MMAALESPSNASKLDLILLSTPPNGVVYANPELGSGGDLTGEHQSKTISC